MPSIETTIARLLRYLRALILSVNSQFNGSRNKYAIRLECFHHPKEIAIFIKPVVRSN